MLKRTLSAIVITLVMIGVTLCSGYPLVLNFFVAAISAMAIYEVLVVTKYVEGKWLKTFALIIAVLIPFAGYTPRITENDFILAFFIIAVILLVTLILFHKTFSFEHICVIFCMAMIIPVLFSTLIAIRKLPNGIFAFVFVFASAWGSDCGGYLFGKLFGIAKFSPTISPKKTVEGVIGCLLAAVAACLCLSAGIDICCDDITVNYLLVVLYALVGAVFGIIGDLSASVIKRCFGVKDFGSLIPGHGGIMDRFDSILFAAPAIYILMNISPAFINI